MDKGWIKLHRKIQDNPIFYSDKGLRVWLWCLLKAGHQEKHMYFNNQKIQLKEGQFITGRLSASEELRLSPSTLRNWLATLKQDNYLDIKTTNKYSIITILNWKEYQADGQLKGQQNNNRITTEKHQNNTNKNDKKEKNDKNTISKDIEAKPKEYGNENINWLLKEFENIMGFKSASNKDRIMAHHLLNNFTSQQLQGMLKFCATQEYAPRIGSIEKMWFKRGDIIAGIKAFQNKANQSNTVRI